MKLLLDTSTFLWAIWRPEKLSVTAAEIFADKNNSCYLSHVSVWEMTIKFQLGKGMPFKHLPKLWVEGRCRERDITLLPLTLNAVFVLPDLPFIHKDPFDRMLVAQALANGMTLLTNDGAIAKYPVPFVW